MLRYLKLDANPAAGCDFRLMDHRHFPDALAASVVITERCTNCGATRTIRFDCDGESLAMERVVSDAAGRWQTIEKECIYSDNPLYPFLSRAIHANAIGSDAAPYPTAALDAKGPVQ